MSAKKDNDLTFSLFNDMQNNYNFSQREIIFDFDSVKDDDVAKNSVKSEQKKQLEKSDVTISIMKKNLCKQFDFSDLPLPIVGMVENSLMNFRTEFPQLPLIDLVTGYRGIRLLYTGYNKEYHALKNNCMTTEYSYQSGKIFIVMNPEYYKNPIPPQYRDCPIGCGTPKADFEHELGHVLDFFLDVHNDKTIKALFRKLRKNKSVKEELSEYGNKNTKEFIAEGYSEFCNNPAPRETACIIANRIKALYKQKYN